MYIARWSFSTPYGKTDAGIAILRKWEVDVGERIGWKVGSVRIVRTVLGSSDTNIEFETEFENLSDLEAAWGDMERAHYNKEYLHLLEPLIVPGTSRWTVYREMSVAPKT